MYQKQTKKKDEKKWKQQRNWSEQSVPSLVKKKTKRKMVKKHANKSHYNFDNLNVVNLKTKRKNWSRIASSVNWDRWWK